MNIWNAKLAKKTQKFILFWVKNKKANIQSLHKKTFIIYVYYNLETTRKMISSGIEWLTFFMAFISSVSANQNTKKKRNRWVIEKQGSRKDLKDSWDRLTFCRRRVSKWALKKEDGEEDECDKNASFVSHRRHFQKMKNLTCGKQRSDEWREVSSNKVKVTILTLLYSLEAFRHFIFL